MLTAHIIIALSSLVFSVYAFFYPSKRKLNIVYGLTGLIFVSGFALILGKHASIARVCSEGLVYLGVMVAAIFAIRHKLARQIAE